MIIKKQNAILALLALTFSSFSQGGIPGVGNTSTGANFLGFNTIFPSVNSPLQIRNNFNNQIRLFTNNTERLRVFQFGVSPSCPTGGEPIF
jgi:hypothetical protein